MEKEARSQLGRGLVYLGVFLFILWMAEVGSLGTLRLLVIALACLSPFVLAALWK